MIEFNSAQIGIKYITELNGICVCKKNKPLIIISNFYVTSDNFIYITSDDFIYVIGG